MKTKEEFVEKINELLDKYIGGVPFFDELDKTIRDQEFHTQLLRPFMYEIFPDPYKEINIIVSGGFGRWALNSIFFNKLGHVRFLIVNGGMRDGLVEIDNLNYLASRIKNQDFIFLDDSFYSGNTRDQIKNEIERLGGSFKGTVVAYDGAPKRDPNVYSIYRYYDYHNNKGEKI